MVWVGGRHVGDMGVGGWRVGGMCGVGARWACSAGLIASQVHCAGMRMQCKGAMHGACSLDA